MRHHLSFSSTRGGPQPQPSQVWGATDPWCTNLLSWGSSTAVQAISVGKHQCHTQLAMEGGSWCCLQRCHPAWPGLAVVVLFWSQPLWMTGGGWLEMWDSLYCGCYHPGPGWWHLHQSWWTSCCGQKKEELKLGRGLLSSFLAGGGGGTCLTLSCAAAVVNQLWLQIPFCTTREFIYCSTPNRGALSNRNNTLLFSVFLAQQDNQNCSLPKMLIAQHSTGETSILTKS